MYDLVKEALAFQEDLAAWRRHIHQNPELSLKLPKTKKFVMERLGEMGIVPQEVGESGLVVLLGDEKKGKCKLIRCDMDALPMKEETGLDYAATGECMHACGHDMHATMLLGAAKLLKAHEEDLKGCVKLVWQPAEETLLGAQMMVDAGVMEKPHVDEAITIHCDCMSPYKLGSITILNKGTAMASNDTYRIDVEGCGTHGAFPNQGVDPIVTAATIVVSLQEILSREIRAADQVVVTQGMFHAGTAANVIPSTAYMEGTIRTFDSAVRAQVRERVEQITENIGKAFRCEAKVSWLGGCDPLYNDPDTCDCVARYVDELLGEGTFVLEGDTAYASEDFSNFLSNGTPGAQLFLVVGSTQDGARYPMHNPKAVFDDSQLYRGASTLACVALRWLAEH